MAASSSSTFSSPALLSDHRSPPPCKCSFSYSPRSSRLGFTLPAKRSLSVKSTVGEVSYRDPTTSGSGSGSDERIESLKLKLLSTVSELNRGLVASLDDLQRAETAGGFNR